MPHRGYNRSHCRNCDRERERGERFSARGKCFDCGTGHMLANAHQLRAHDGPWFQHWRRACLAAFGVTLPAEHELGDEPES